MSHGKFILQGQSATRGWCLQQFMGCRAVIPAVAVFKTNDLPALDTTITNRSCRASAMTQSAIAAWWNTIYPLIPTAWLGAQLP